MFSRSRRSLTATGCALAFLATTSPAWSQSDVDRATARSLGEDGEKALAAKDYKTAETDFRKADSIIHAPTLLIGLARALVGEGRLVEAQEAYRRIIREGVAPGSPAVFRKAVDDATAEVQTIAPKIGAVTIAVKDPGGAAIPEAQVTWDGTPVNAATLGVRRPANPGTHVVHAAAEGYQSADLTVEVPAGGAVDAPLTLQRAAAAPAPPADSAAPAAPAPATTATNGAADQSPPSRAGGHSMLPWIAFGVGGAGLVVGGITGALALSKHSDLAGKCSASACGPAEYSDVDSYNTLGLVSTVGFIVAGVGAAAGVTLLLLQPKSSSAGTATGLQVTPVVGPGSLGAVGSF
jgi:hypothetical protein